MMNRENENQDKPSAENEKGQGYYLLWGILLWLMICAVILFSGSASKFIYIDF